MNSVKEKKMCLPAGIGVCVCTCVHLTDHTITDLQYFPSALMFNSL